MGTLIKRAGVIVGGILLALMFLTVACEYVPLGNGKLWNARDGAYDEVIVARNPLVEVPLKPGQRVVYRGP